MALVITDLDVGGAERAMVALATGLDRTLWEPAVICLGPPGVLVEPLERAGIGVTCLGASRSRPDRVVFGLARALRAFRPAIVQSFLFHANVASRLAARLAGRPPVVGGLRVAEHRAGWHLTVDRITTGLGAGSVCVSEGVRDFARDRGGLDPGRLVVIPNGVEVGPHDRAIPADRLAAFGAGPDDVACLFVGRLDHQKGVDVLIDAAAVVAARIPHWRLALAGDGPDREALHARAASIPELAGRIAWLGRREDVPSLLAAADLLVLPSRWEGMPNAILEAMAARRAVVASAVEGSTDLVFPDRTGWLVPPGDPGALAAALIDAASDRARLRAFGGAGRARVEAEHAPGAVVAAYQGLWARVLETGSVAINPAGAG